MRCSISMAPDLSPERYSTSTEDRPLAITCCRASEVSLSSNFQQIDWSTTAKFEVAHQEQQDGLRSIGRSRNSENTKGGSSESGFHAFGYHRKESRPASGRMSEGVRQ